MPISQYNIIIEKRTCFKILKDLHDNVTDMLYVDTYSQSGISINLSSNA